MPTTFKRIILAGIAFIVIAGMATALVMSGGCSANSASPLDEARNGAVNAALDLSGIKGRIDSQMRSKASELASQIGVSQAVVDNAVDSLAIEDWQATSLPADAIETGTYTVDTDEVSALVTTYDDPSIVTVEAYGQTITMAVPASAQSYVPLLKYLEYAN